MEQPKSYFDRTLSLPGNSPQPAVWEYEPWPKLPLMKPHNTLTRILYNPYAISLQGVLTMDHTSKDLEPT